MDLGLLREAVQANAGQPDRVLRKVRAAAGGQLAGVRVGLLGLAFKANTGDLRDSPALAVARRLAAEDAVLTGYDPCVPASGPEVVGPVRVVDDPYLVAKGASVIVVLTEATVFRQLDWTQLAGLGERPVVVDTRNLLDPGRIADTGMTYVRLGAGTRYAGQVITGPAPEIPQFRQ
jgi:UDPglucose 6-dehydrogenase